MRAGGLARRGAWLMFGLWIADRRRCAGARGRLGAPGAYARMRTSTRPRARTQAHAHAILALPHAEAHIWHVCACACACSAAVVWAAGSLQHPARRHERQRLSPGMPCHALPRHAMPCHALPRRAVPRHAMQCHTMCHAMCDAKQNTHFRCALKWGALSQKSQNSSMCTTACVPTKRRDEQSPSPTAGDEHAWLLHAPSPRLRRDWRAHMRRLPLDRVLRSGGAEGRGQARLLALAGHPHRRGAALGKHSRASLCSPHNPDRPSPSL